MCGNAAFAVYSVPSRLTATISSAFSTGSSVNGA
jgi:hypothetical protein